MNIDIHNVSKGQLLDSLRYGGVVFTPNIDHLIKLQKDFEFYQAYKEADYRICDSQILLTLTRLLGNKIQEKISGSDLLPAFCDHYKDDLSIKIFLLGSAPGVAHQAKEKINTRLGRTIVVAAHSPSFNFEQSEAECQDIINLINASEANVLAIGVGAPKQERWIRKYRCELKFIKVFLAIGAAIDFESGLVKRSPTWISNLGLEWFFRFSQEPRRLWKRYFIDDLPCVGLIFRQYLKRYQDPWEIHNSYSDLTCKIRRE